MGLLDDWGLSYDEINELLTDNPSLRSFIMGYAAEIKFRNHYLHVNERVTDFYKPDDHDRSEKGDWIVTFEGESVAIEVKSLQTSSLVPQRRSGVVKPKFQCDASDSRSVSFEDGTSVTTTSLLVGEFDIVAVNIHALTGKWDFAFCRNSDLVTLEDARNGVAANYSQLQRKSLIKTTQALPWPLTSPYTFNFELALNSVLQDRNTS